MAIKKSKLWRVVFCWLVPAGLATLSVFATACHTDTASAPPSPAPPPASQSETTTASAPLRHTESLTASRLDESTDKDFDGGTDVIEKKKPGLLTAILTAVRTASHARFDRVVFEFQGTTVPGYRVEYLHELARECGSGLVVSVAGQARIVVRFTPAKAHTDEGKATVRDRALSPALSAVKALTVICDYEGEVEWLLGLATMTRFRVLELTNPPRLVVDVEQPGR